MMKGRWSIEQDTDAMFAVEARHGR
jgi:hypothetical protein